MRWAHHLRAAWFATALAAAVFTGHAATACPSEPTVGSICMTAANFCPQGYAEAKGQILTIAQNAALFSLLGTTYGGNGRETFALPDLQGRVPVGDGKAGDRPSVALGEQGNGESVAAAGQGSAPAATTPAWLAIKFCIAIQGIYPSRN